MIINLQKLFRRTIIIFGITTIIQLILRTELSNTDLYELLILAFAISFVRTILFKETSFAYSIPHQIGFLILVWLMVIGANYLFTWNYHMKNWVILLGIVLVSYLAIRLITYNQIKDEAHEMNRFLKNRNNQNES